MNLFVYTLVELPVGAKRLQYETVRVKLDFGSEVEPYLQDKQTNALLRVCICRELPS